MKVKIKPRGLLKYLRATYDDVIFELAEMLGISTPKVQGKMPQKRQEMRKLVAEVEKKLADILIGMPEIVETTACTLYTTRIMSVIENGEITKKRLKLSTNTANNLEIIIESGLDSSETISITIIEDSMKLAYNSNRGNLTPTSKHYFTGLLEVTESWFADYNTQIIEHHGEHNNLISITITDRREPSARSMLSDDDALECLEEAIGKFREHGDRTGVLVDICDIITTKHRENVEFTVICIISNTEYVLHVNDGRLDGQQQLPADDYEVIASVLGQHLTEEEKNSCILPKTVESTSTTERSEHERRRHR